MHLTLFTEEMLQKCRTGLKYRKEHNLNYNDVLIESGYHRQCYMSFTGLIRKYDLKTAAK